MRIARQLLAAGALATLGLCGMADAWGPSTRSAIVAAGTHVLGRDSAFTLSKLLRNVAQGADLPEAEFNTLFPLYKVDPVGAIQREMVLLQTLKSDRLDPYYAFRLGVLGRMVADATAPLATDSNNSVRDRYYADVERAISRANMAPAARKFVDVRPYFLLMQGQASSNDKTIEIEYQGGIGFNGIARKALSQDASRSVNAVADVWHTLLTAPRAAFDEPVAAQRDYILGSIGYYLKEKNIAEANAAYALANDRGLIDPKMQKAVGDLYFDNALYEEAIAEYQKILAADPGRRDVVERVAKYYEMTGDDAATAEKLETARDAYAKAADADSLHPEAQRKLLNVEARIYARDERLAQQKGALDEAREFENRAEEAAIRRDYARAISLLHDAEARYAKVTDEFAAESKDAINGRRNVMIRTKELKQELIDNSLSLSGSGGAFDARQIAGTTPDTSKQALQGMLQTEYHNAVRALGEQPDTDQP